MSTRHRAIVWGLSFVSVGTVVLLALILYCHMELTIKVLFAREQVRAFLSARDKARTGSIEEALQCLDETMSYYPSGSKQTTGSALDEIVETSRKLAMADIIAFLRQKSKRDFGDNAKDWLETRKSPASH